MLFRASAGGRPHERLAAREPLASARQSAAEEDRSVVLASRGRGSGKESAYPSVIGWRLSAGTHMRRRVIAQTAPSSVPILRTHSGVSSARALDVHMAPVGERRGYKARLGRQRRRSRRDAYFQFRSDHRNASSRRSDRNRAILRTPRRVPKLGVGGRREWQVDRCRRQRRYAYVFHVLNLVDCCSCEARRATACISAARSRCRAFGSGWSRAVVVVSNFELFARVMTGRACAGSRFQGDVRRRRSVRRCPRADAG
jgi:hypothetical protein